MLSSPDLSAPQLTQSFKQRDFEVTRFIGDVCVKGNEHVSAVTHALDESLSQLQQSLNTEVIACHERLLENTFSLELADTQLGEVRANVANLRASMAEIKTACLVPFRSLKEKVVLLGRAQRVNTIIRKYLRFEFDLRKLRAHVDSSGGLKDYVKAALSLKELEGVLAESTGLENLTTLRRDVAWIREQSVSVRRRAEEDLKIGIKDGNQQLIESSTQAFFNLGCLNDVLTAIVRDLVERLDESFSPLLRNPPPPQPAVQIFEQFLLQCQTACRQIQFLDSQLATKTDPITHEKFASEQLLGTKLWPRIIDIVGKIDKCVSRGAITAEYPRLCTMIQQQLLDPLDLGFAEKRLFFENIDCVHGAFLQETFVAVTQPVELMLSDNALQAGGGRGQIELPTLNDARTFLQILRKQLDRLDGCPSFLVQDVVKNIRTAVLLFVSRVEAMTDADGLVFYVEGPGASVQQSGGQGMISPAHQLNARLCQLVSGFLGLLLEFTMIAQVLSPQLHSHLKTVRDSFCAPFFQTLSICWERSYKERWRAEILQGTPGVTPGATPSPSLQQYSQLATAAARRYLPHYALQPSQLQREALKLLSFALIALLRGEKYSLATFNSTKAGAADKSGAAAGDAAAATDAAVFAQQLRAAAPTGAVARLITDIRSLGPMLSGALGAPDTTTASNFELEICRGFASALETSRGSEILQLVSGDSGALGSAVAGFARSYFPPGT